MIRAIGGLIRAEDTKRYLLVQRSFNSSYPLRWGLVGGKVHHDEKLLDGLSREITEELGFLPPIEKWVAFNCFTSIDKKFQYHSLLILTPKEFIPKLNKENDGYCWVNSIENVKPLHPRLREVITSQILSESIKNFI